MFLFTVFVFWIVFCGLVAAYASSKGQSAVGYFFLALFFSPLIAFLIAVLSKPDREAVAKKSGLKKCPQCAEYIQAEALVCRFCGRKFDAAQIAAEAAALLSVKKCGMCGHTHKLHLGANGLAGCEVCTCRRFIW